MAEVTADKLPVFDFMVVRAPKVVEAGRLRRHYVHDEVLAAGGRSMGTHVVPQPVQSVERTSAIGRLVYNLVFCAEPKPEPQALEQLLSELLGFLVPRAPWCEPHNGGEPDGGEEPGGSEDPGGGNGSGGGIEEGPMLLRRRGPPIPVSNRSEGTTAVTTATATQTGTPEPLVLHDLDRHAHLRHGGLYYVLPDRLDQLTAIPLVSQILAAEPILESASAKLDVEHMVRALDALFDDRALETIVFAGDGHSNDYAQAKRGLFDVLYLLYMLRRWVAVSLEQVMHGLRVLHLFEALAIDRVIGLARTGTADAATQRLLQRLGATWPQLRKWDNKSQLPEFPLVATETDVEIYLSAVPVVHSIFARLFRYTTPFNDIKPVGVGDLKVVKQWLCGYRVGEIAHVENVLQSEKRERTHRELEKTEEVFSLASEQQEETQRDTQTTDRFEIKREAESVVKSDISANAGLNVSVDYQGTGYKVISTLTGGFAYSRSQTDTAKVASNYARDVVDKAVRRVQTRATQQRSTTKLFEAEETTKHGFNNSVGKGHISGLYRWLDKEYRSRIYNYGKRMMFEFVVPEPAAFLVEARLRAFEADLELPQVPTPPKEVTIPASVLGLEPSSIDAEEFERLGKQYDLGDLTFPALTRTVDFVDTATGRNYFTEHAIDSSTWQARSFTCRLNAKDYRLTKLIVEGYVFFWGRDEANPPPNEINTFEVYVDGRRIFRDVNHKVERWYYDPGFGTGEFPVADANPFGDEQVTLFFGFWDVSQFDLSLHAELELSAKVKQDFQRRVYHRIVDIEQKKVNAINDELRQAYQSQMATYRNRLTELRATAVNELLQGQSEAFNRQLIVRELKRQCLALLTKDFDADPADDTLTNVDAVGSREVNMEYHRFLVEEQPTQVVAGFERAEKRVSFPAPDLPGARRKGRYVQFLEQAFEWQQLAYVCYPYFWGTPPRWVELMSHADRSDPALSAFLQAGSAKVLLAVTPHYDDAVTHYIETGEPWDGGDAPLIGDPLYIPLYEELRRQQDDLANAKPEGDGWNFTLPTSLVYLENSSTPLPPRVADD